MCEFHGTLRAIQLAGPLPALARCRLEVFPQRVSVRLRGGKREFAPGEGGQLVPERGKKFARFWIARSTCSSSCGYSR